MIIVFPLFHFCDISVKRNINLFLLSRLLCTAFNKFDQTRRTLAKSRPTNRMILYIIYVSYYRLQFNVKVNVFHVPIRYSRSWLLFLSHSGLYVGSMTTIFHHMLFAILLFVCRQQKQELLKFFCSRSHFNGVIRKHFMFRIHS